MKPKDISNEGSVTVSWKAEPNEIIGDWSIYEYRTKDGGSTIELDVIADNLPQRRAVLMAAAPDLLEACMEALKSVEQLGDEAAKAHIVQILGTAIQKASSDPE